MKKVDDPAKKVFQMLAFQYKPLEKRFINDCSELGGEEGKNIIRKYQRGSYALRITMLDKYANWLGL